MYASASALMFAWSFVTQVSVTNCTNLLCAHMTPSRKLLFDPVAPLMCARPTDVQTGQCVNVYVSERQRQGERERAYNMPAHGVCRKMYMHMYCKKIKVDLELHLSRSFPSISSNQGATFSRRVSVFFEICTCTPRLYCYRDCIWGHFTFFMQLKCSSQQKEDQCVSSW